MKINHVAATLLLACLFTSNISFGQTSVCVGEVTTVTIPRNIGCSYGPGYDITWDGAVGGALGAQSSGSSSVDVTWTTTGTFRLKRVFPGSCSGTPIYRDFIVAASPSTPSPAEVYQQPGTCGQVILNYTGALTAFWQTYSTGTDQSYQTTRTVTSTGTYYLRAKNAGGCWSTAQSMTVGSLPASPVGGTLSGGGTWYGSVNINLNLGGQSGNIIEYRYSENGSEYVISNTSTTLPVSFSATGSPVTRNYWAVIQLNGCQSTSSVAVVTVNSLPAVSMTACVGQTTSHSIPRNIGCGYGWGYNASFVNNHSGGMISDPGGSESSFTVTWTTPGIYTLQRTFPSGCTPNIIITQTVQVFDTPPTPLVSEVAQQPSTCGQVVLSYTGGSGSSYWQTNALGTDETYSTTRTVTATQDYHLRVKSSNGCWSGARTVTVSSLPPGPTGGTLSGGGTWYGSVSTNLNLGGQSGSIKEYRYSENGGEAVVVPSTSTLLLVSISNPSSSTITRQYWSVIQLNGCETSSGTTTITINPVPAPNASISINDSACGSTIVTQNNPLSPTEQYDWWWQTASDGTSTALGKNSSAIVTSSGPLFLRARTKNLPLTWGPASQSLGTISVHTMPSAPTSGTNASGFYNNSVTLSIETVPTATSYRWYDSQSGGNLIATTFTNSYSIPNLLSTTPLFVATVSGGCETAGRFPITATLVIPQIVLQSENPHVILGEAVILGVDEVYDSYAWKDSNGIIKGTQSTFSTTQPGEYTVIVTKSGMNGAGVSSGFKVEAGPYGQNRNFIITNSILVEGVTASSAVDALNAESNSQVIQYFDGLGRPAQSVTTQGSPNKKDIVQPVAYDQFGREPKKYLPYVSSGNDGWYKENVITAQGSFYSAPPAKVASDTYPYLETIFEPSPLNRVVKQGAPGEAWQPNGTHTYASTDHTVKFAYEFNVANEVLLWTYTSPDADNPFGKVNSGTNGEYYAANQLYKNKTKDEEQHEVIEYVDKQGRLILKKAQADGGTWAQTYYVYDDFGKEVCVIQPEGVNQLAARYFNKTDTEKNNFLKRWAFRYRYDGRRREVMTQVPGAEPVYIVYDKRDRVVLTQDGNQRVSTPKYWSFTKYDELNRPILTGIKDTAVTLTQAEMQTVVNAHYNKAWAKYGEIYIGNSTGNTHGYTNKSYPATTRGDIVNEEDYLSVTYYDDYSIRTKWIGDYDYINDSLTLNLNGIPYTQPALEFNKVNGLVTATKIKVLDDGIRGGYTWLKMINYYDDKYRPIQSISDNYKGGLDRVSNLFDFTGKVLQTKNVHHQYDVNWKNFLNAKAVGNKLQRTTAANGLNNSGAVSKEILAEGADGWFEFTASEANILRTVGLAVPNSEVGLASITYAFYLNTNATLTVYESGVSKGNVAGGYKTGDKLKIERVGTNIRYYRNNVLIYTSLQPSSTSLIIDAALNSGNASIVNSRSSFSSGNQTIVKRFEYDHIGRLLRTYHKVNDEDEVLLSENEYNELGELVTKKLHSEDNGNNFKQHVDYRYNIRGWVTRINNSDLEPDDVNEPHDFFGMNLHYNDIVAGINNTPQFNGNVSAAKYSTNLGLGVQSGDASELGYKFSYDAMSRLTASTHMEKSGSWSQSSSYHEDNLTYDLNGSPLSVNRKGAGGTNLDQLTYVYEGNQVKIITDAGDKTKGFRDGDNTSIDYVYDANGSLVWDRNKGGTESLSNGEFENGSNGWTLTDTGSRLTFADNEVQIIAGSANAVLMQNVLVKSKPYVVVIDMERTAGTLTVYLGGTSTNLTSTGQHVLSVTSGNSNTEFRLTAGTTFVGKIKSVSVKGVTVTIYNHLNLPEIISRAGDQQMQLIYDATGRKLAQELSKNGVVEKRTEYVGEYYYENDTLKFIHHEEGRIIPETDDNFTYQYSLKDHLANERLVFTTKHEQDESLATMEDANAANEQGKFLYYNEAVKVNTPLFDHTNAGTTYYSTRLNGSANEQYGLAKSLSVMPGDTIKAEVYAKYLDTNSNNWTTALINFMAAIAGGTAPAGTVVDGGATGSTGGTTPSYIGLLNKSGESGNAPKAYLNYLIFDRNFVLLNGGFVRMSENAREYGQDGVHEKLEAEFVITQPGYVYVYLSNDNVALGGSLTECYFDDLKITQSKSAVLQEDFYYPFGAVAKSVSREDAVPNKFLYQGKEYVTALGIDQYDNEWRWYDPWGLLTTTPDPHAHNYSSSNPYSWVANNPMVMVDPDGQDVIFSVTRNKKGEITGVTVSSTIYITGTGASEKRANELNKASASVFKSRSVDGVNVSFNINYKYAESVDSKDLKAGENVLNFVDMAYSTDENGVSHRSHVNGYYKDKYDKDGLVKRTEFTGRFGEIYKDDWNDNHTVFHESLHFTGISDRYYEYGKAKGVPNPIEGFENDIMGSRSMKIGYDHYSAYYRWATDPERLKKYPKRFLSRGVIDSNFKAASKTQMDEQ